ncbi:MAG: Gfo/Idh/MocA family oxidoreductase [Candidatus Omnitrophica bacterium]|nr:Gfo/Idh/MocA family oxidoreductase [Candidatus Omnitrophota bacterium]
MPSPDRVGLALVGTSGVSLLHGLAIRRCPSARLVALCGSDPQRTAALARRLETRPVTAYDQLLDDPLVQAVDIVTEPARHAALAIAALRRGKHVLVEKPLDEDLGAAEQLVEAARRSGRQASVVAPKRFDPVLREIRQRLLDGAAGSVIFAQAAIRWHRDAAYYHGTTGWRSRASVLLNQGIHWLDVFIWFFGSPESVWAQTVTRHHDLAAPDTALVCARHPAGELSLLQAGTAFNRNDPELFEVHAQQASFDYQRLTRRARRRRWGSPSGMRAFFRAALLRRGPSWPTALEAQLADVAHAIQTGEPPQVSLEAGLEALRFVKRCEASALSPEPALPSDRHRFPDSTGVSR